MNVESEIGETLAASVCGRIGRDLLKFGRVEVVDNVMISEQWCVTKEMRAYIRLIATMEPLCGHHYHL